MKRQLKTLKGKRVVLTNNANEITRNEIGIIEKQDGTLEVKEHDANGNIENIAGGVDDDFLSYRYFKNGTVHIQGKDINIVEVFGQFYSLISELDPRPNTLSLPFIVKIAEVDYNTFTDKKYQIKFIDIMYDQEKLNDFEVLGVMIPKYLSITLVSSAPGFGNSYPEYNMPCFDCMKEIFQVMGDDEAAAIIGMVEKSLQQFEITREEFLTIGN